MTKQLLHLGHREKQNSVYCCILLSHMDEDLTLNVHICLYRPLSQILFRRNLLEKTNRRSNYLLLNQLSDEGKVPLWRSQFLFSSFGASLLAQMIKNLPAMENQVQSLGWEDPLKKGMVTHSKILAWRIPWIEEPGGLQSMGFQRVGPN